MVAKEAKGRDSFNWVYSNKEGRQFISCLPWIMLEYNIRALYFLHIWPIFKAASSCCLISFSANRLRWIDCSKMNLRIIFTNSFDLIKPRQFAWIVVAAAMRCSFLAFLRLTIFWQIITSKKREFITKSKVWVSLKVCHIWGEFQSLTSDNLFIIRETVESSIRRWYCSCCFPWCIKTLNS